MARKRYEFTEARIARYLREGRGSGTGKHYLPWLTVFDVPSRGRVHRVYCPKTDREHHLLSDNEYYAFLLHWWADDVIDIREQFPLLDRRKTIRIAALKGIRHPSDPRTGTTWVMTTDFLITRRTSVASTLTAVAVKQTKDLSKPRTLAKLEIERSYWAQHDIEWTLMVSDDLKSPYTRNLAWILGASPHLRSTTQARLFEVGIAARLAVAFHNTGQTPARVICLNIDRALGVAPGSGLAVLRGLLSTKQVRVDLNGPCIPDLPGTEFTWQIE